MLLSVFAFLLFASPVKTNTIGVLVFDDVLTSEISAPKEVFGMAAAKPWFQNWKIILIGVGDKATYTTAEGLEVVVDTNLAQAPAVQALIVPGAHDMDALFRNQDLVAYIKQHQKPDRWLASNCAGAFLLGHAGVLDGYSATTWYGGGQLLAKTYPDIKVLPEQPLVLDRMRLTSNGGVVSYDAAFVLLGKLTAPEKVKEVYQELQAGRRSSWEQLVKLMK